MKLRPRIVLLIVVSSLLCAPAALSGSQKISKIVERDFEYEEGGVRLKGFVAYDASLKGKRPGVLVVHQWKGLGEYEKYRARLLAEMGYVAFAADIYGADTRPSTNHEASMAVSTFRNDRAHYRRRLEAAIGALRAQKHVDPERLAAIGYCFGGTGVLELARSGANLAAVVSFHGGLSNPNPELNDSITAFVQVHHAALDASITPDEVKGFWKEMNDAKARWDLRVYSGAQHGFTEKGDRYDERADRESWSAMNRLFEDLFKRKALPVKKKDLPSGE